MYNGIANYFEPALLHIYKIHRLWINIYVENSSICLLNCRDVVLVFQKKTKTQEHASYDETDFLALQMSYIVTTC